VITSHAFPDFTTNITVGFSNKTDPSVGSQAVLQIQSLDISKSTNNTLHTLLIHLTDDNFTSPGLSGDNMLLSSTMTGTATNPTAGDVVTFQSFADPGGNTPGLQSYTSTGASTGFVTSPNPATSNFVRGATFTLSNDTSISVSGGSTQMNVSGSTTVSSLGPAIPEPTTATLIGLTALPLLYRRSRRVAKA